MLVASRPKSACGYLISNPRTEVTCFRFLFSGFFTVPSSGRSVSGKCNAHVRESLGCPDVGRLKPSTDAGCSPMSSATTSDGYSPEFVYAVSSVPDLSIDEAHREAPFMSGILSETLRSIASNRSA